MAAASSRPSTRPRRPAAVALRWLAVLLSGVAVPPSDASAQAGTMPLDSAHSPVRLSFDHVRRAGQPSELRIALGSTGDYSCLLHMQALLARRDSVLTLRRFRIQAGGSCPSAVGPASGGATIPLDTGRYLVEVNHLGRVERYGLEITDSSLHVRPRGETGVASRVVDTLAWLAPRNSFVLRCGSGEDIPWVCADLVRELGAIPGLHPFRIPSDGRNPFGPVQTGGMWHNEHARYYRFDTPADHERAVRAMQTLFARVVGTRLGTSFGITTSDGRNAGAYSNYP